MAIRWYAAQTKPNAEAAADRRLRAQDFVTFLPRLTLRLTRPETKKRLDTRVQTLRAEVAKLAQHVGACASSPVDLKLAKRALYFKSAKLERAIEAARGHRTEPLFRSYIFVQLDVDDDPGENWKRVNSTRAVQSLLPHSDRPEALPSIEIENLRRAEQNGEFTVPRLIDPGASVRVFRGTLVDQVLEALGSDKDTVKALWDCFGRKTVVSVPLDDVTVLR